MASDPMPGLWLLPNSPFYLRGNDGGGRSRGEGGVPAPDPGGTAGKDGGAARVGDPVEGVLVGALAVEAPLAKVKVVARLALEPGAGHGGLAAPVARHAGMETEKKTLTHSSPIFQKK